MFGFRPECADAREAMEYVEKYFSQLKEKNYFSPIYYPALTPEGIFDHLKQNANPYEILFEGIKMTVSAERISLKSFS